MPPVQSFVRAEMLPSGYLIRPCDGGGCIIHIVDHVDLEVSTYGGYFCPIFYCTMLSADNPSCFILLTTFNNHDIRCDMDCASSETSEH